MSAFKVRITTQNRRAIEFDGPSDITAEITDAIVNAANSSLIGGGGVDGAIHRSGGPAILDECKSYVAENGRLATGRAMLTAGGRLSAKYVIHTVGPVYSGRKEDSVLLASCYRESMLLADKHNIRSLAFPAISTGAYGYPLHEAAAIAVNSVIDTLEDASNVELVRFVLFDAAAVKAHIAAAEQAVKKRPGCKLDGLPESA